MTEDEYVAEVRRLNPGRDDIKVRFVGGMPMFEHSNRLGPPKRPKTPPLPKDPPTSEG